jgi:hypothetical protein
LAHPLRDRQISRTVAASKQRPFTGSCRSKSEEGVLGGMRPQRPPSWPASWHSYAKPNVAGEPVHAVLSLGHCAAQAMARMGAPTAKSADIPGHPWARNKQGPLPPETPAAATGRIPHCTAQGLSSVAHLFPDFPDFSQVRAAPTACPAVPSSCSFCRAALLHFCFVF